MKFTNKRLVIAQVRAVRDATSPFIERTCLSFIFHQLKGLM